ncbi:MULTISPECIES: hypothetical protein [unclassified Mycobacterium]|uniref:hypothetical protein n=1 Tax=unclassified Mycobacterium TaxID=2642494 RepID=UPI001E29F898|nr:MULTISPECIES: hypothetical protein [unclassified Mycobacterium]
MRGKRILQMIAIASVAGLVACSNATTNSTINSGTRSVPTGAPPSITNEPIGQVDATLVSRSTLVSGRGMRVRILTYGGIFQSIEVPDRTGHVDNVVLGV